MRNTDLIRLLFLSSLWGASFLCVRILSPVLGPFWTTEVRVGLAALAMLLYVTATGHTMRFRANWKPYLVIGILNSALPFALYAYAALTMPAGYLAIVNATSPLWGALAGAAILGEKLTPRKIAGLAIGATGVAFLVRLGPAQFSPALMTAALACVGAAICYGLAGVYSKKITADVAPPLVATGSQLTATLLLLPFLPLSPLRGEVTPFIVVIACTLALLCNAVALFLYFRLIADIGPTRALTVTFLSPLFALAWGAMFLNEAINLNTLIGCGLVVFATWLVLFQAKSPAAD